MQIEFLITKKLLLIATGVSYLHRILNTIERKESS
jgi:hypothetical protein